MVLESSLWLYLGLAAGGVTSAVAGLLLRARMSSRFEFPVWLGFALSGLVLGLGLGCGLMHTLGYRWTRQNAPTTVGDNGEMLAQVQAMASAEAIGQPIAMPDEATLQPGEKFPQINVESWLNGPSAAELFASNPVTVVDVWSEW